MCPLWRPYRLFPPILLNLSSYSYGYSETTLSTKIFFSTYRCLFFTQTQSDQNPHTKSALFSTSSITFLRVGDDWFQGTSFLDARDHAWSNGKDALKSIPSEKKSMFSTESFSSVTMGKLENDKRISLTYSQMTLCYSRTWRTKVVCSSLMHTQTFTQTRRCRRTCKSACHRVRRLAQS